MVVNYLYNTVLELVIFVMLLLWILGGCTILIPILVNIDMDYWDLRGTIESIRMNKIKPK